MKKALIVVDMQNDFVGPDGKLYVSDAETIVESLVELIKSEQEAGNVVFFTMDWHPKETPHFKIWPEHCVQNTEGAKLVPELLLNTQIWGSLNAWLVHKGMSQEDGYSGFENPILKELLNSFEIEDVTVVGVAGDFCVRATALDAARLGFNVTVLKDYVKFVSQDAVATTLDSFRVANVTYE